jgi:hypothetical protein
VVSSCGVNFDAQTNQVYTPSDGENYRSTGGVDVLNAVIVSDSPGTGRLIGGLVNGDTNKDDTLTQVRGLEESQAVQFQIGSGETTIPAGGLLQLADPGAADVTVSGDPQLVSAGGFVRLAISFQNGEDATLNVPVVEPGETYGGVDLSGTSASPSAGSSASPSASPSE